MFLSCSEGQLSPKAYVGLRLSEWIDEPSILRLDPDDKFKEQFIRIKSSLTNPKTMIDITVNNSFVSNSRVNNLNSYSITNVDSKGVIHNATEDMHLLTKAHIDSCHQGRERSRRDVGLHFCNSDVLMENN